jgi:hypothetical protein
MSGGGGSVTLTTSLPIPSGKSEVEEGDCELEVIEDVDVMAVHPRVRTAVSRRIIRTDTNFFILVFSFPIWFYI